MVREWGASCSLGEVGRGGQEGRREGGERQERERGSERASEGGVAENHWGRRLNLVQKSGPFWAFVPAQHSTAQHNRSADTTQHSETQRNPAGKDAIRESWD